MRYARRGSRGSGSATPATSTQPGHGGGRRSAARSAVPPPSRRTAACRDRCRRRRAPGAARRQARPAAGVSCPSQGRPRQHSARSPCSWRVVRVVTDEVGERDQVGQVAVAQVPQPVGGVHRAVERRVAGQRPVGPAPAPRRADRCRPGCRRCPRRRPGRRGRSATARSQRGEGVAGPARRCGTRTRARPRPVFDGSARTPRVAQRDRQGDLAEPPGQRGRRAEQQARARGAR